VTASYVASGKKDQSQSMQQLDMQVTLADDRVVSGRTTIQYAYTWTNACGPNSIKGSGSGPSSGPSIYAPTKSTYKLALGLGVLGASESKSQYDVFFRCALTESSSQDGGFSLGVPTVGGSGDLETATTLSGSQTLTRGAGCAVGLPEYGLSGYDTCTLTITWNLTKPTCDPALLSKALREYDTATSFVNAGVKELKEAAGNLREVRDDYALESAEVGAEKFGLLQLLHVLDAGYELNAVQIAEVTGLYVGIGVLLEEIALKFYPTFTAYRALIKEAEADFERAKSWSALADADMKKALAQGPCVGPVEQQLNKLLDEQKKQDEARAEIDSWENNGSTRYISPINGDVLDEKAALKLARDLIAAKTRALQSTAHATTIKLTAKRAHAALKALNRAIAHHAKAKARLDHAAKANAILLKRLTT
jgi:hypothetical protein